MAATQAVVAVMRECRKQEQERTAAAYAAFMNAKLSRESMHTARVANGVANS